MHNRIQPHSNMAVIGAGTLGIAASKKLLAAALLAGGGLSALQTSVLVTGAPFAIIIAIAAKNLLARLENLK